MLRERERDVGITWELEDFCSSLISSEIGLNANKGLNSFSIWPLCNHWPVPVAARSKRRSAAACVLGLRVRIPPGAWLSVPCEWCVLSGRGLCDGPVTRLEESYRVWCVQ